MLALIGGTAATILDSYAQKMIALAGRLRPPLRLPDGYTVTVRLEDDDGRRRRRPRRGLPLDRAGRLAAQPTTAGVRRAPGGPQPSIATTGRPHAGERGPVRLMCEILDYRYARYISGDAEMIHPLIHRGLWRDLQVWLPAIDYSSLHEGEAVPRRAAPPVPVALKVYPPWAGCRSALGWR